MECIKQDETIPIKEACRGVCLPVDAHDLTLNQSFRWTESSCKERNLRELDGIREKEVFAALRIQQQ